MAHTEACSVNTFLMFSALSVSWLVGLLAGFPQNYWTDFSETDGRRMSNDTRKRSLNVGTNLDKGAGLGVLITLINIVNLDRKIQEYGGCWYP